MYKEITKCVQKTRVFFEKERTRGQATMLLALLKRTLIAQVKS